MIQIRKYELSIAFQTNKPLAEYSSLARQVEYFGFDRITVYNDMLYQPCWLPLLQIAQSTKTIGLGVASVNPFTSHPITIAGNIALIDEYSRGRAYLGFARGAWLDFVGIETKNPILGLKEAMGCVRHLLSQSSEPYLATQFPLAGGDSLRWKIMRADIPFLLGTWGPKTIEHCIYETTEIKLGGTANPDTIPWLKTQIRNACRKTNRNMSDIGVVIGAVTVVDLDGDKARELARKEVALYLPIVAHLDPTISLDADLLSGIQKAAAAYNFNEVSKYIDDNLLEKFAFVGTPEEIVQKTIQLFRSGVNRVEFGTPHGILSEEGLNLLGREVLPIIRDQVKIIS